MVLVLLLAVPLLKLGRTLDEATIAIRKAHEGSAPLLDDAQTTLHQVNTQLERVDGITAGRPHGEHERLGAHVAVHRDARRPAGARRRAVLRAEQGGQGAPGRARTPVRTRGAAAAGGVAGEAPVLARRRARRRGLPDPPGHRGRAEPHPRRGRRQPGRRPARARRRAGRVRRRGARRDAGPRAGADGAARAAHRGRCAHARRGARRPADGAHARARRARPAGPERPGQGPDPSGRSLRPSGTTSPAVLPSSRFRRFAPQRRQDRADPRDRPSLHRPLREAPGTPACPAPR